MSEEQGQGWEEWLAAQRAASTVEVEVLPLGRLQGWSMTEEMVAKENGTFFRVIGVHAKKSGREVAEWDQPIIDEVGEGMVLLFKAADEASYLVAAKIEPGNACPGRALLAAPFQASRSNLEQAHGGKRPPRAELLDGREVRWVTLHQDGGRFYGKMNRYAVLEIVRDQLTPNPNERWMTRDELRDAYRAGALNEHLAQALLLAVL